MSNESEGIAAIGTLFKRGDGTSSEAFATVAEVIDVIGPNKTRITPEVTASNQADGYREFVGSFIDGGEVTIDMNLTRDGYVDMNDDMESASSVNYQIVIPDTGATTLELAGLVNNISPSGRRDDRYAMNVTIKVSGKPSLAS